MEDESVIKRIQPHNDEAEKSLIGSMIMNNKVIDEVFDIVRKEDFYQPYNAIMFEAIYELYNNKSKIDMIILQNSLIKKNIPENIARDYIKSAVLAVQTSVNAKDYAKIVKDKSILRKLIKISENISNECYMDKENVENILENTEKSIFKFLQLANGSSDILPIKEVVLNVIDQIDKASKNRGQINGIATGFTDLDNKLTGLHPSELILVAARPAMGKTAFVLNIAQYVTTKENIPAVMFSLEMSQEQLVTRLMSLDSMVNSQSIRTGDLQDDDWEKLMESATIIGNSNLIIDDTPGISISELRSKCRKYKQVNKIGLIIIDYLQLMSGSRKNVESRQQEVSEISRSLKALARELNVPIIALSQLSRAADSRTDHRPILSDLRESGAIEQDADVVMFIYRDEYYNKDSEKKNIAEINIAKQRNGSTGTIELIWLGQYTKFANKA